jgi:hypothetical protein
VFLPPEYLLFCKNKKDEVLIRTSSFIYLNGY